MSRKFTVDITVHSGFHVQLSNQLVGSSNYVDPCFLVQLLTYCLIQGVKAGTSIERWQNVLEQNDGISPTVFGCYPAISCLHNFYCFF